MRFVWSGDHDADPRGGNRLLRRTEGETWETNWIMYFTPLEG